MENEEGYNDFSVWTVVRANGDGSASIIEITASEDDYNEKVIETYNLEEGD